MLSAWATLMCELGFLPRGPWDEDLGAIIYLRGDPGRAVKGWSSEREGKKTSKGWANECVIMVGNWGSAPLEVSERLYGASLGMEDGVFIHQLPFLTGGGVLQGQKTLSGRNMQGATSWMEADCH